RSSLALLSLLLPLFTACGAGSRPQPVTAIQRPATAPPPAGAEGPAPAGPEARPASPRRDPHSFSHPDEVAVEHLQLTLSVDFERRVLTGRASLRLAHRSGAAQLYLDTRDLDIQKV